jgi:hypothetical protein
LVCHTEGGTQDEGVENRVLRKIFGPKRDEVTGDWRRLRNEELQNKKSEVGEAWHVWGRREMHTEFWLGNPKEGDQLERHRRRWEDDIEMGLQEIG